MNKRNSLFFFVLLLFLTPIFLFAQNSNQSDYLVLSTGDTLYGRVQYIKERGFGGRSFHKKVRITDANGKRKKYKRKNVSVFSVDGSVFESFWLRQQSQSFPRVSLENPRYDIAFKNGGQHFLKIVSEGRLNHYELEWFDQESSALWSMSLLKKEGDRFFIRADQGLFGLKRKVLLNCFSDCPKLQEKIQRKELKKVHQVVTFYNTNCLP